MRTWLLLVATSSVWACDCGGWPSAKGAWETSPVVFLGHVERTEQEYDKLASPLRDYLRNSGRQSVWVKVDEAFKGVKAGAELQLEQPGHNCAPKFRVGEKVVFYLNPASAKGVWEAYGCHRTRKAEEAADDLLFLRALPWAAQRSRLSGEVQLFENSATEGYRRVRHLSNVPIRIHGAGRLVETVTNADGVYEVYDLPEGSYRVQVDLPQGLAIRFRMISGSGDGSDAQVLLKSGAGADVRFVVVENNLVSGRVVDPNGRPLPGVPVALEPVGGLPPAPRQPQTMTQKDGTFQIKDFPSGEYLLVANRSGAATGRIPFGAVYLPGTSLRSQAQVLSIRAGQPLENLVLRIPKLEPTITVSGRVQFSDGKPVAKPILFLVNGDKREQLVPAGDSDGRFQLSLLAGTPARLQAFWTAFSSRLKQECPDLTPSPLNPYVAELLSEPALIPTDANQAGLLFILPAAACNSP